MSGLSSGELAEIARRLVDSGVAVVGPLQAELIAGGRSNLTYAIADGSSRWVVRTPPRAGRTESAHEVIREFRVAAALQDTGFPVAAPVLLCEDERALGVPFTVSEFVDGTALRTQADLAPYDDTALSRVVDNLLSTLASLHRVDHAAVGLESFGRPDGYAARQLRRWSRQWQAVGGGRLEPLAREVVERLGADVPDQRSTSVVHGDYRIDNTLLVPPGRPGSGTVAAVVDWELSTIGDPVGDVAMMCAYRDPIFDLVLGAPSAWTSPRLPRVEELAGAYVSAGGVPLDHWDFHLGLACFKVAVISAGIEHRRRAGSGSGAGFDTAGQAVEPYLELALAACRAAIPRRRRADRSAGEVLS